MANLASLGILLVVFGHSLPTGASPSDGVFLKWVRSTSSTIYLFHMPLFFFMSGYLFRLGAGSGRSTGYLNLLQGKAKRLLLPYLCLGIAALPIKAVLGAYSMRPVEMGVLSVLRSFICPWQHPIIFFWFLPTLFLMFAVAPALAWLLDRRSFWLELMVTAALVVPAVVIKPIFWMDPVNYRGVMAHLIHFWFGMLIRAREPSMGPIASASVSAVGFLVLGGASALQPQGAPALGLTAAVGGVLGCYALVRFLTQVFRRSVPWIDDQSYQIYLLSWFFQTGVRVLAHQIFRVGLEMTVVATFVAGVAGPLVVSGWIRRYAPSAGVVLGMSRRDRVSGGPGESEGRASGSQA